ncbi:MAG: non-canonical purine NTP pyrophosphatase [Candidatus Rokubacteria bacterium]|nr:non-canonical purine NTP pyrophosphatase [Candidatus Rokubacteria bacterium]
MSNEPVSRPLLVIATLNEKKGRELVDLLGVVPYEARLLASCPGATLPEEVGATYAENALIKARAACRATGALALGDDSGLEIDALPGELGLRTARFGGPGLDDAGRYRLLLDRLRDVPEPARTARFRCVIALVAADGAEWVVEGMVGGRIASAPRGTGGFGYDPVFFHPPSGLTFGQLSDAEKARLSHRGLAVAAARRVLLSPPGAAARGCRRSAARRRAGAPPGSPRRRRSGP